MTTLIWIVFLAALYFPVVLLRSKWTRYSAGRAAMVLGVVIAATLGVRALRAWPGWVFPEWLSLVIFLAILVALLYQDVVLTRSRRRDRRDSVSDETEEAHDDLPDR